MVNYENFYSGGVYGLEQGSDTLYTGSDIDTGATISQASIGASTGVQTANQLKDVSDFLNQGMKTIEVSTIQADVFDMIPKQHLKEINRLSKLTGSETTFHAPIIEPSGFTEQGGWSEQNRVSAEAQLSDTIIRAHALNPDGDMPATIHASSIPGMEKMHPDMVQGLTDREKKLYGDQGGIPVKMIAVNQDTGELIPLKREERYNLGGEKDVWTPEDQMRSVNNSEWVNKLTNLEFYKKEADEAMQKDVFNPQRADMFLENIETSFNTFYDRASKFAHPEIKKQLAKINDNYKNFNKNMFPALSRGEISQKEFLAAKSELIGSAIHQLAQQGEAIRMDAARKGKKAISEMPYQLYKPVEEFAINKASQTFGNVAFNAYNKLGDKAPIVSIENPPYGSAISTAGDLKNLIIASRKEFVKKAVDKGMSSSQAESAAKKMIGATWDTSHISMIRKQGFGRDKLIKEAEIIAPYVKHVHLNDNFGFSHTDLPPGMGDVPIKEIMGKLKEQDYKGKHIFEGGNFFQHFKTPPHAMVIEAMGSPMYSGAATPTWTGAYGTMGTYSGGYGPFLPEQHFSTYGSGFSGMPTELGGQMPGKASRFSGTPNS